MLKIERHNLIMRQINLHNRVLTSDLVSLLAVSEDTIRRDLQVLSEDNRLIKVHGGALSAAYQRTSQGADVYAKEAKQNIAKKAIEFIKDGMVIIIWGGTTIIELVRSLPKKLDATFFTICPFVAIELAKFEKVEVILIGGLYAKHAQITYGAHAITQLSDVNADLCLMGASSFQSQTGCINADREIDLLKESMLRSAKCAVILCISEKLNVALQLKIDSLANEKYLITELTHTTVVGGAFFASK